MNPRENHLGLLPAFLVLSITLLPAQTRKLSPKELPPSAFKLISIKVTGTKRYTQPEIVAATDLELGQTVSEADFRVVSQHLGDTGAFSDVVYSFQYSSEGTKLELQLTDSEQLVPARFDNFVWFSDQELQGQLHTRVPLFQGQLPVAGNLADQVSDALQALLIERKVNGRADYLRVAHGDSIEAINFSASGPNIRIRNVEFTGAAPAELPLLGAAAKKIQGADYLRSGLRVHDDKDFLPIYRERGYLKAAFGDAQAKIVQDGPQDTIVDVTVPVDPGSQYKLSELQLSGAQAFPAAKLRELIHLQPGQTANAVQLERDIEAMKGLYGSLGYLAASVAATPEMDDAQSTVKYRLSFQEGDIYKMGELEIQGLDSRSTSRLEGDWKLRGGDAYDSSYPGRFVEESLKELSLMGGWDVRVHQSLNEKDKTVDVTLRFDPKPAK